MPLSNKWKTRWRLLAAGALIGLGLDTATFSSRLLMSLAVLLTAGGAAWFLAILLTSRAGGVLYRKRQEILLALGTASITLLLVVAVAAFVRLAPRRIALENQRYDAVLGWAPPDVPDKAGQRGQDVDPARAHIIVLGDSILYGHGVETSETAPYLLEGLLGTHQVLNFSVSGYSIDQYYLTLKRALPRVTADLVVVGIFTGNDLEVTGLEYGWGHTKPLFRLRNDELILHNPDLLADNCIDHLAQSLLFRTLWMRKDFAIDLIEFFCDPVKLGPEELDGVVHKLFAGIEDEARAHGARVLFVLLPTTHHLRDLEDGLPRYSYNRLRDILAAGRHDYYELYPDIFRAAGEEEEGIFIDGAHYTPRGHKLLADSLARVIREKDLLRREQSSAD